MIEKKKNKSESKNSETAKKIEVKRSTIPEEKHGKLTEAAQNIEAGIEVAGDKITELAGKTAETAGELYQVLKNKISSTYDSSAKIVDDLNQSAQEYIEKYKQNLEIKRLTDDREQLTQKLGTEFFSKHKLHKEENPDIILKNKVIQELLVEIENLDKKIVKIGKKLETSKN